MAGEKGAPRITLDALADAARAPVHLHPQPSAAQRLLVRAHRLPQGHGARGAACATARPRRERALDRLVDALRPRPRAGRAVGPRRPARPAPQRRARAAWRCAPGVEVVATNNVHYATPARRPLATALAAIRAAPLARRDRRLAARRAVRAPAQRRPSRHRRFARWPGAVERTVEIARGVRVRPAARGAEPARLPGARRPHRDELAARAHPARRGASCYPSTHPQHDAGDAPDRLRARRDRAARLPRLLPAARTTSSSSAASTTSTARGGGARRTARSATRSASPRPTRSRSACCSSGSSRPSATVRPTSTSTSSTSAARR